MCVIIYKPKDKKISTDVLSKGFRLNNDGFGIMAWNQETNRPDIIKCASDKFEDFAQAYEPFEDRECAIHFRIRTHGAVCDENCHPYKITDNAWLMHNGVIYGIAPNSSKWVAGFKDEGMSDSSIFADLLGDFVVGNEKILKSNSLLKLIDMAIGSSNKLVLMVEGEFFIINERAGVWRDSCWYSNHSAFPIERYGYGYGIWEDSEDRIGDGPKVWDAASGQFKSTQSVLALPITRTTREIIMDNGTKLLLEA